MAHKLEKDIEAIYKQRLSWRYNRVQLIGLPSLKDNRDLWLEEIYVPLSFTRKPGDKEQRFYLPKALSESRHLVILGDPGCGKSTLVKLITHAFGRSTSSSLPQHFGPLLPIPIILRDYRVSEWKSYEDMLRDFISKLDEEIRDSVTVEWLISYLEKGQAIVLLDGIDEIGSTEARRHLRDKIFEPFLVKFLGSYFVLTSRIIGYEEVPFDLPLKSLGRIVVSDEDEEMPIPDPDLNDFRVLPSLLTRYYIAPFSDEDIEQFITRWYTARETDSAQRNEGIKALKRALELNDRVKRLAGNPSLLTLIALIFRVTADLPSGRVKLYDKITEAYLETIEKYRGIGQHDATLEQKRRWLARIGWEMQSLREEDSEVELLVTRNEVMVWLKEAIAEECENAEEEARHFLDYIARRSGLLIPRGVDDTGNDLFSFVHLTFQEYFAALYLKGLVWDFGEVVKHVRSKLTQRYWHETILVLFEMLAELRGSGDRLVTRLTSLSKEPKLQEAPVEISSASYIKPMLAKHFRERRQATAEILSALLLDSESGLSPMAQQQAAQYVLAAVCDEINNTVINNLRELPKSSFDHWIAQPMKQQLSESEPEQWSRDFLLVGDDLVLDWPQMVKEVIITHGLAPWPPNQVAIATLICTGSEEAIAWAVKRLPLHFWLSPIWGWESGFLRQTIFNNYTLEINGLSIAEANLTQIFANSNISPKHYLLTQSTLGLAARRSLFLRIKVRNASSDQATGRLIHPSLSAYTNRDMFRADGWSLARCFDRALERYLDQSLARFEDWFYEGENWSISHFLSVAIASHPLGISTTQTGTLNSLLSQAAAAEWLAFQPHHEAERLATITRLQSFLNVTDDWTRLLAINNLITLSAGTPELVAERNWLCNKAMQQPGEFTFPAELREATQDKEWFNLPEVIAIIFLHSFDENGKSEPFLKPEWFDPKSEESKFFLSPPREFFALAAEVLDPEGETELAKWRK